MVLMHIIIPAAGRMRLKTSQSGICSTKRSSAESVSRFTRMFVPNPKKGFQYPGTQSKGFPVNDGSAEDFGAVVVMNASCVPVLPTLFAPAAVNRRPSGRKSLQDSRRIRDPPEDAPLGLDHFQPHLVELGEVRGAAVAGDQALVAAV